MVMPAGVDIDVLGLPALSPFGRLLFMLAEATIETPPQLLDKESTRSCISLWLLVLAEYRADMQRGGAEQPAAASSCWRGPGASLDALRSRTWWLPLTSTHQRRTLSYSCHTRTLPRGGDKLRLAERQLPR